MLGLQKKNDQLRNHPKHFKMFKISRYMRGGDAPIRHRDNLQGTGQAAWRSWGFVIQVGGLGHSVDEKCTFLRRRVFSLQIRIEVAKRRENDMPSQTTSAGILKVH